MEVWQWKQFTNLKSIFSMFARLRSVTCFFTSNLHKKSFSLSQKSVLVSGQNPEYALDYKNHFNCMIPLKTDYWDCLFLHGQFENGEHIMGQ